MSSGSRQRPGWRPPRPTISESWRSKADADPSDSGTLIELGRALAANQEYEPGLDQLLKAVALKDERLDEARQAIFDVFELLGDDHPLTLDYRKRLANQLF